MIFREVNCLKCRYLKPASLALTISVVRRGRRVGKKKKAIIDMDVNTHTSGRKQKHINLLHCLLWRMRKLLVGQCKCV